jgi:hypothetical protein
MPYFSDKLDIYENYTRGELCDLMNIDYNENIERAVYKPTHYSTIIFFSTIHNNPGYIDGKISDTEFLYSANNQYLDTEITQHQFTRKELLLFVRIDQETGFYYFGRCNYSYSRDHRLPNYLFPLYCLELLETRFSNVIGIDIPDLFI